MYEERRSPPDETSRMVKGTNDKNGQKETTKMVLDRVRVAQTGSVGLKIRQAYCIPEMGKSCSPIPSRKHSTLHSTDTAESGSII